jgi:hypothetical protein
VGAEDVMNAPTLRPDVLASSYPTAPFNFDPDTCPILAQHRFGAEIEAGDVVDDAPDIDEASA